MRALVLLVCLVAAADFATGKTPLSCSMSKGKKIRNFANNARFDMDLPCKFKAIAGQKCGDYQVTVSPGSVIDFQGYIFLNSVYMKVLNVNPESPDFDKEWNGRTDIRIAKKFLSGNPKQTQPFNSLLGSVGYGFCDIFDASKVDELSFTITAKTGDFSLQYNLIDEEIEKRYRKSGFEFVCNRDEELKPYPKQICGNLDDSVLPQRTEDLGFPNDDFTLLFDVLNSTTEQSNYRNKTLGFESEGLFNSSCERVSNAFERRCDEEQRKEAVRTCGQIVMSRRHVKCLATNPHTPLPGDVFWYCVEFVCSGYKGEPFCPHIAHAIDSCPEFKAGSGLTKQVRQACGDRYPITTKEEIQGAKKQKQ